MDKTGIAALVVGIVLLILGGYAIVEFLPDVVVAVKGLTGIVVLLAGLMFIIFGVLIFKE
jgi:hypothetical protein